MILLEQAAVDDVSNDRASARADAVVKHCTQVEVVSISSSGRGDDASASALGGGAGARRGANGDYLEGWVLWKGKVDRAAGRSLCADANRFAGIQDKLTQGCGRGAIGVVLVCRDGSGEDGGLLGIGKGGSRRGGERRRFVFVCIVIDGFACEVWS